MAEPGTIYTIGHSTHEIDVFLTMLAQHKISAVADVRSTPASRLNSSDSRCDSVPAPCEAKLYLPGAALR